MSDPTILALGIGLRMASWVTKQSHLTHQNKWDHIYVEGTSPPSLRFVLFTWAGGSCTSLNNLAKALSKGNCKNVQVRGVELPGRMSRFSEKPLTEFRQAAAQAVNSLSGILNDGVPYVFVGYSLGSLFVYRVALELQRQMFPPPLRVFCLAMRSPTYVIKNEMKYSDMSNSEFIDFLGAKGGTPKEVLTNVELMKIFLPAIRGDYSLLETFCRGEEVLTSNQNGPEPSFQLKCPITTMGGNTDYSLSKAERNDWENYTDYKGKNAYSDHVFQEGHFFILKNTEQVAKIIFDDLNYCCGA